MKMILLGLGEARDDDVLLGQVSQVRNNGAAVTFRVRGGSTEKGERGGEGGRGWQTVMIGEVERICGRV